MSHRSLSVWTDRMGLAFSAVFLAIIPIAAAVFVLETL